MAATASGATVRQQFAACRTLQLRRAAFFFRLVTAPDIDPATAPSIIRRSYLIDESGLRHGVAAFEHWSRWRLPPVRARLSRAFALAASALALGGDGRKIAVRHAGHVFSGETRVSNWRRSSLPSATDATRSSSSQIDQPVAAEILLDFGFGATVRDQFIRRRHVDAVDVRVSETGGAALADTPCVRRLRAPSG